MAQNKINDNIVSDADMSLNGKIILPENNSEPTHLASEKKGYNVTVFEAKPSTIDKSSLIYEQSLNIKDDPIKNQKNKSTYLKNILKGLLKYAFMHLRHPIWMLIADISILFMVAPLFIGYTNTVYLTSDIMQGFISNPIVIAISIIFVMIFLAPFIFSNSDLRTDAEKKEDARVDRIINRIYR